VRGLVHVVSHTADPPSLTAYGALTDDRGRRFTLRWRGEGVAEVTEQRPDGPARVSDRGMAEKLGNTRLYVDRAQLPAPHDADEFYVADLLGMTAVDTTGEHLGKIAAVHDYGAGASLEIAKDGAAPLLVPFTRACVPEVDTAARRVTLNPAHEVTLHLAHEAEEIETRSGEAINLAREAGEVEAKSAEGEGHGDRLATPSSSRPPPPRPARPLRRPTSRRNAEQCAGEP